MCKCISGIFRITVYLTADSSHESSRKPAIPICIYVCDRPGRKESLRQLSSSISLPRSRLSEYPARFVCRRCLHLLRFRMSIRFIYSPGFDCIFDLLKKNTPINNPDTCEKSRILITCRKECFRFIYSYALPGKINNNERALTSTRISSVSLQAFSLSTN